MLWALIGVALALPPALLGPDGPMWVGPLPPETGAALVVVVDPQTGELVVEATERDGRIRKWTQAGWTVNDELIDPETPAAGHRMDQDQLVSAETLYGASQQFQYDEASRLSGLVWANGGRMTIRYDESGRVRELVGPGTQRFGLNWANGLDIADARGRSTRISTLDTGPNRSVTVTDPMGRTVTSRYRKRDEDWVLTGWTDPRGLETRVGSFGSRMDVTAPGGRVFRLELTDGGEVVSVAEPGGRKWRWERDEDGRLVRMFDPGGRSTRIEYNESNQPIVVAPSGRIQRIHRDGRGHVVGIQDASGAHTQFVRDADGRIRSVIDALGNALFIERYPNGWPSAVLNRAGARWNLAIDSLGKPSVVEGPMGRIITLHRDGAGLLARIEDNVHGSVGIARNADGELVKVTDEQGRITRFERDGTGRVHSITQADGTIIQIARDPMGEVTAIRTGDQQLKIVRTPEGFAREVGEWSWERDINGRVRKLIGPKREITLFREPAGWIRGIQSDDWRVDIQRDVNGWPNVWSGVDGDEEVQRDSGGRIVVDGDGTRVLRDSRGEVVRITLGKVGEWRMMRDAAGRTLSVRAPGGATVGMDRDAVGRPKWFRFPDGSMLRRLYEGAVIGDVLVDPNGHTVGQQQWRFDADGRMVEHTDVNGQNWRYHRDDLGRLEVLEADNGQVWIWDPQTVTSPDGHVLVRDGAGRMMESQLGTGPKAWGVATNLMSVHRDEHGEVAGLGGDDGLTTVQLDALGRLTGFRPASSGAWEMKFDAQGRPLSIVRPDGTQNHLKWAPDADPKDGLEGLLVTGQDAEVPWAFGAPGMASRLVNMEHESVLSDPFGTPSWVLDGSGGGAPLFFSPMGFPQQAASGLVGSRGQLQWFPGGPIQWGMVALDPVSGDRVDGVRDWPWVVRDPGELPETDPSDPTVWDSGSAWYNPLFVLQQMGVFAPVMNTEWRRISRDPKAHQAVSHALDGAVPPLGPHREALPLLPEDPITEAMITALMPGGEAPGQLSIAAALIEAEIDLPWLPPGLTIPGLEIWRNAGAWSD